MEPLPVPLLAPVIVIQSALLLAVQTHPAWVVTAIELLAASGPNVWLAGATVKVHGMVAACVRVKVCLAIRSVPIRAAPVLAATAYVTWPLPLPVLPLVTVIHAASLLAVQEHEDRLALTDIAPV